MAETDLQQDQDFAADGTLERVLEVSQALIAARDLKTLLNKVAESAGSVLNADIIVLYEYREDIDDVTLPPVIWGDIWHREILSKTSQVRPHKESAVFKMLARGTPFYAANAGIDWGQVIEDWPQEGEGADYFVYREGIASSAAVPLIADDKRVGVLFVNYRTHRAFLKKERRVVEFFAVQAAIAIRHAHRLQQEQILRHQAETLRKVSTVISSALDLEELVGRILDELKNVIEYRKATMQLIHGDTRELIAYRGFSDQTVGEWLLRPVSRDSLVSRVVTGKRPLILSDTSQDPDWEVLPETADVKSWVGLPLVYGGETIGLLTLDHDQTSFYTDELEDLFISFAHQAAIAISNARLVQELKDRADEVSLLQQVSAQISAAANLREILSLIVNGAIRLTGTRSGVVHVLDRAGERIVESFGHPEEFSHPSPRISAEGYTHLIIQTKQQYVVENAELDSRTNPGVIDKGVKAFVGTPLKLEGGRVAGVLYVNASSVRQFTGAQLSLLRALGDQAAIAIWNAQRVQELDERATQLERLQEVTATISREPSNLNNVLQLVVNGVREILPGASCSIRLYHSEQDEFEPQVAVGILEDLAGYEPRRHGTSRFVIDTQVPRYLEGDAMIAPPDGGPPLRKEVLQRGVKTAAYLPLVSEGNVVGILYIYLTALYRFSRNDRQVLELLADQATIAIQNARLYEQISQQLDELSALHEVSKDIVSSLNWENTLQLVADRVHELTESSRTLVVVIDERTKKVTAKGYGYPPEHLADFSWQELREGVSGWVIDHREPVLIPNVQADSRCVGLAKEKAEEFESRSLVIAPLLLQGKVIGTLTAVNARGGEVFTQPELDTVTRLADLAAIAIENARLFEQLQEEVAERTQAQEELAREQHLMRFLMDSVPDAIYFKDLQSRFIRVNKAHAGKRWFNLSDPAQAEGKTDFDFFTEEHAQQAYEDEQTVVRTGQPLVGIEERETWPDGRAAWVSTTKMPLHDAEGNIIGTFGISRDITDRKQAEEALEERATQLLRLQKVTAAISAESRDLDQILRLIADSISSIFLEASCIIRLYDSKSDRFELQAAGGTLTDLVGLTPRVDGTSRYVLQTRQPRYLEGDALAAPPDGGPAVRPEVLQRDVKAAAYLPLFSKGDITGILYVDLTAPHHFSGSDKQILDLFADQAAIAIENARLYEQRIKDIAALQEINAAITAQPPEDIFKLITQKAKDLTQSDYSGLWIVAGNRLIPGAMYGTEPMEAPELPINGNSLNGWVAKTAKPYRCFNVKKDPHYLMWREEVQSSVAVPLKLGETVIGTLGVESTRAFAFSDYQIRLLQSLGDQAAIVIQNVRLYEQRSKDIAALQEINEAVASETLDSILELCMQKAVEVMPGEYAGLWMREPATGDLVLKAAWGPAEAAAYKVGRLKAGEASINVRVAETGEPFICENAAEEAGFYRVYEAAQSSVTVPLKYQGKVIGTINVESSQLKAFTEQHMQLLDSFSDQAAIAIENARLYEQLQEELQRTATLSELGDALAALE